MNPIYLYKSGELKKKDDSLVLITKEEEILFPIEQVDSIYCFGTISFNTRLLEFLNRRNIDILFFNYYGTFTGRFLPRHKGEGRIYIAQSSAYTDPKIRLSIAKAIQKGAFHNMLNINKYYQKKGYELGECIQCMEKDLHDIQNMTSVDDLMLLEARTKKKYYESFDLILKDSVFVFDHRTRQPPENELNALLSYGYSLLYATILAILDGSYLTPDIPFIHSVNRPGPALHLDLADIFKPVIVDRLVLRLIRRRSIKLEHFQKKGEACYLNNEGIQIFLEEYNSLLKEKISVGNQNLSYRSILKREVHHLTSYIDGKDSQYHAFVMKW